MFPFQLTTYFIIFDARIEIVQDITQAISVICKVIYILNLKQKVLSPSLTMNIALFLSKIVTIQNL